jgi:DNA ligase-associated metallophosphoesterase
MKNAAIENSEIEIIWAAEKLTLLPERAIWWAREKTLFIADPHFGKASAFRFAGIAVPETSHDDDLARLEKIVRRNRAKKLIVLGDFFHAKTGRSEATFSALKIWRERHSDLEIILIIGNHDQHAGCPPDEWKIVCVREPFAMPPFFCFHKPPENLREGFALAGHVHPAFSLYERSGISATSVCFYFGARTAILPAFGNFTGKHILQPTAGDKIFLVTESEVIDATRLLKKSGAPGRT